MQTSLVEKYFFKATEYPLRYQRSVLLKTVSIQFVLLFVFLLLFKPFGTYAPEYRVNYVLICFLHALSPAVIIYAYFYCLGYVYEHTSGLKSWTLLREYAHLTIVFFLTGIASFLLRSFIYNNPDNWSWHYLAEEILNCYLAGILFYFILLFAGAYFRSTKSPDVTQAILTDSELHLENLASTNTEVFIKTQVQQDDFSFNPAHLLFAKAEGNYIEVTLGINNRVSTTLKRISLKQFEVQLTDYPFLFRCHRAYLVNLQQIKKVSGNAQGYTLTLNLTEQNVLVSRTQLEMFNNHYEHLTGTATV
ncbi:LytTR family transcriptional regulator [Mucilaginibacter sp. Bleaf8]|uniref:LytTR family DNA-binding domain-containing protein n=1 Tax=Mucilaginibacter sp. Bleaf8 TaxID=2834430 RepID=UPI001BCF3809|nr:LytTR family DNA-binding domain-containing protein [Mucilaginibacter sp. Bleaf8]MBS7566848.1 LytTR family transcriptional regulator [Mucilaginibacter sp. Bleaf8]